MKAMVQLDSDKARLHSKGDQAARDIVQFVRECQNNLDLEDLFNRVIEVLHFHLIPQI